MCEIKAAEVSSSSVITVVVLTRRLHFSTECIELTVFVSDNVNLPKDNLCGDDPSREQQSSPVEHFSLLFVCYCLLLLTFPFN